MAQGLVAVPPQCAYASQAHHSGQLLDPLGLGCRAVQRQHRPLVLHQRRDVRRFACKRTNGKRDSHFITQNQFRVGMTTGG